MKLTLSSSRLLHSNHIDLSKNGFAVRPHSTHRSASSIQPALSVLKA